MMHLAIFDIHRVIKKWDKGYRPFRTKCKLIRASMLHGQYLASAMLIHRC